MAARDSHPTTLKADAAQGRRPFGCLSPLKFSRKGGKTVKWLVLWKRDGKLFFRCLLPALLSSLLLLTACGLLAFAGARMAGASYTPMRVGLVCLDSSREAQLAVRILSGQEDFQALIRLEQEDTEEDALKKLREGEYSGVIVLPEHFVNDIISGKNTPGRVITGSASPLEEMLLHELAQAGGRLLSGGQAGVYALQDSLRDEDLSGEKWNDMTLKINLNLIAEALSLSSEPFQEAETPLEGSLLPLLPHFLLHFLVFFLFVSGAFFQRLFSQDRRAPLLNRFAACGLTPSGFLLSKFFWIYLYELLTGGGLLALLSGASGLSPRGAALWAALLWAGAGLLLVSSCILLCFSLFSGGKASLLLLLSGAAAGLLLSGGWIPLFLLPEAVRPFSGWNLHSLCAELFLPLFGIETGPQSLVPGLALSLGCAGLSLLCLRRKGRKEADAL